MTKKQKKHVEVAKIWIATIDVINERYNFSVEDTRKFNVGYISALFDTKTINQIECNILSNSLLDTEYNFQLELFLVSNPKKSHEDFLWSLSKI